MNTPDWFDPGRDRLLSPKSIRGLVHPIRLRLLDLLQVDGPATATSLAARINQSSGVTSYHLRVLAEHGFITEDTERGNGRDRWWRAPQRSTSFTFQLADDAGDREAIEDSEQYLRLVAADAYRRMVAGIDSFMVDPADLAHSPWQISNWPIRLTVEQARAMTGEINALASKYRRQPGDPDPTADTIRAHLQFQLLPEDSPEDQS